MNNRVVRLWAVLCIVLLLLSGCAAPAPQQEEGQKPVTVYGETPTQVKGEILLNGAPLTALYEADGELYLEESEFLLAVEGETNPSLGTDNHTISVTVGEQTVTYETAPKEGAHAIFDGKRWYLPCEDLMEKLGYHLFEDAEENCRYITAYPKAETLYKGVEVPVLMYHAVGNDLWGTEQLFVSPASMEEQLKYLKENGYTPIWFEDLAHVETIEKPIILTFDDGYGDIYTNLYPLLKEYEVKATVFLITGSIGGDHYLTEKQIQKMYSSGYVSIQSHTVTHPDLSECSEEELKEELLKSKGVIAKLTGKEPFVLCYPKGKWSKESLEMTDMYYEYGVFMSGEPFVTGETDPLRIYRKYISRSTTLDQFKSMIG
ncbi:MAG: polysaccharide deacetylase family protein [Lachnospiraceae bacterium]|nr:polysaccharide deacetylase family protein [Lachnospiraceae bacterium]